MDIEEKHWKAIEEVTGLTKEVFEGQLEEVETMEEEITQFLIDIRSWINTSRQIVGDRNINFNPELFLLWKLWRRR